MSSYTNSRSAFHDTSQLLVILVLRGIIAAIHSLQVKEGSAKAMTKRLALILLAAVVMLVGSLGCALGGGLAQRFAAEPTSTRAPTKTPRPTFTATPDWTATPTVTPTPTNSPIPSDTLTPVPTDTPLPTDTPTPEPPTATFTPAPPRPTDTPAPPTPTSPPSYPFVVESQSNREFTHTNNPFVYILVEILDPSGTPLGGYRIVGDSSTGEHKISEESCHQRWCKTTGSGGYAKVGNVSFEPGPFIDGSWTIYMVDGGGQQVSPAITLNYSSDSTQWVWDHILMRSK
jgi:hypothetical protein